MIPMNDEELVNPEKRSSYIMLDINYFLFQTWRATEEDIRYGRGLKGGHDRFLVEAISSTSPGTRSEERGLHALKFEVYLRRSQAP